MTKTQGILEAILHASQNRPVPEEGKEPLKTLRIEFDADLIDEQEIKETIGHIKAKPDILA